MKLNFKEHIADFAIDTIRDMAIGDKPVEDSYPVEPTYDESYDESFYSAEVSPTLMNVSEEAKQNAITVVKTKGKNLFSLPSMLTIGFFLLSTIYIDVDQALDDGNLSARELFKVFYLLFGGVVTLVARGSEGRTGAYTPKGLPGLSKEDFIDEDQDGIDDRSQ